MFDRFLCFSFGSHPFTQFLQHKTLAVTHTHTPTHFFLKSFALCVHVSMLLAIKYVSLLSQGLTTCCQGCTAFFCYLSIVSDGMQLSVLFRYLILIWVSDASAWLGCVSKNALSFQSFPLECALFTQLHTHGSKYICIAFLPQFRFTIFDQQTL